MFFCPSLTQNPLLPKEPGQPGIWFYMGTRDWSEDLSLIVGLGPNAWLYMGEYHGVPSEPLTKEEWARQNEKVSLPGASLA